MLIRSSTYAPRTHIHVSPPIVASTGLYCIWTDKYNYTHKCKKRAQRSKIKKFIRHKKQNVSEIDTKAYDIHCSSCCLFTNLCHNTHKQVHIITRYNTIATQNYISSSWETVSQILSPVTVISQPVVELWSLNSHMHAHDVRRSCLATASDSAVQGWP